MFINTALKVGELLSFYCYGYRVSRVNRFSTTVTLVLGLDLGSVTGLA